MQYDIVVSGFGGQGVLLAGQLLAYAAMAEGRHVTWFPSYGPEMRGGTANCTVIISDQEVGAPLVRRPGIVLAFNNPSVDKYASLLAPGGCLLYNASIVSHPLTREDIVAVPVPASDLANELGSPKLVNAIMLGALIEQTGCLASATVNRVMDEHLGKHPDLLALNHQALARGAAIVRADAATGCRVGAGSRAQQLPVLAGPFLATDVPPCL